jgi:hypothetical protein
VLTLTFVAACGQPVDGTSGSATTGTAETAGTDTSATIDAGSTSGSSTGSAPDTTDGMLQPDLDGGVAASGCAPVRSSDSTDARYIRAGADGDGTGADWTHAYSILPDALDRGVTYFVAAGEYGDYTFDDSAGDAPIIVRRATCSDHGTDVGWDESYCGGVARFGAITFVADDIVFDGVEGGGPGSWETGLGFAIRSGGHNVHFEGARSDISLAHVDIENNGRYSKGHGGNEHSIYAIGGVSRITLSCSFVHDVNGVHLLTADSDAITIEYSKLARNGPIRFDDGHRESWSAQADDNATIRYNVFEDISNTGYIALVNGAGDAENWTIHGNVFWATGTLDDAGVASLITTRYDDVHQISAVGWEIHNNTIVGIQGSTNIAIANGRDNRVFDNLWYGNTGNTIAIAGAEHDYNWFYGNVRIEGCDPPCNLDGENGAPNDQIGTADPFVDWQGGDFRLVEPTSPGFELDAELALDPYGLVRGADGAWDRGAYELDQP